MDRRRRQEFRPILPVGQRSVKPRPATREPNPMNPGDASTERPDPSEGSILRANGQKPISDGPGVF